MIFLILGLIGAYLIGSVPSSVWIGRWAQGVDVRKEGSGNAGATNSVRVLGTKLGLVVLAIDLLKGVLPVTLGPLLLPNAYTDLQGDLYQVGLAVCAVLGHVFPIYVGFKGGKGVAVLVGVLLVLYPQIFPFMLVEFVLVFLISRYVSLASIISAFSFPFVVYFGFHIDSWPLLAFAIALGLFIPMTHFKNIGRLWQGKEPKFYFKKKA